MSRLFVNFSCVAGLAMILGCGGAGNPVAGQKKEKVASGLPASNPGDEKKKAEKEAGSGKKPAPAVSEPKAEEKPGGGLPIELTTKEPLNKQDTQTSEITAESKANADLQVIVDLIKKDRAFKVGTPSTNFTGRPFTATITWTGPGESKTQYTGVFTYRDDKWRIEKLSALESLGAGFVRMEEYSIGTQVGSPLKVWWDTLGGETNSVVQAKEQSAGIAARDAIQDAIRLLNERTQKAATKADKEQLRNAIAALENLLSQERNTKSVPGKYQESTATAIGPTRVLLTLTVRCDTETGEMSSRLDTGAITGQWVSRDSPVRRESPDGKIGRYKVSVSMRTGPTRVLLTTTILHDTETGKMWSRLDSGAVAGQWVSRD